jgi:hypothetical protein
MLRAYEKRGKNVSDDFFREVKEQLAGAQRLVATIDALH